jgi:endonuclease VIII
VPEGDTVWLSAKRMHDALAGDVLTLTDLRVPRHATADLTGQRVLEVVPRGKHMLTRLDGGITIHTHFKMTGTWRIFDVGQKWSGGAGHEIRIVLGTRSKQAVGYRIPVVEIIRAADEAAIVDRLGPDLLGADWDLDEALHRLTAQPEREIGEALLDQHNLAGIGNLYKAEVLFLSGITPWAAVGEVSRLDRVVTLAQKLMLANRDHWPQVTTGNSRRGEQNWVYGRGGRPCLRCGTTVLRAMQGDAPQDRVCFWCPSCQAGPAPTAAATRPA